MRRARTGGILAPRAGAVCVVSSGLVLTTIPGGCASPPDPAAWLEIARLVDRRDFGDGRLVALLEAEDPAVRWRAARGLGALRDRRAVPGLARALADREPTVRYEALFALGQIGGPAAARAAAGKLGDPDPTMRYLAADAVGKAGDAQHGPAVAALLADPLPRVRGVAALALARLGRKRAGSRDERLARPLVTAWARERDRAARWRMVYALMRIAAPCARAVLEQAVRRRDAGRWERLFALRGLGLLPPAPSSEAVLCQALAERDDLLVLEALSAPRAVVARKAPQRVLALAASHRNPHVRAAALGALGRARPPGAARALRAALEDTSATVRAAALMALGPVAGVEALAELEARLPGLRSWGASTWMEQAAAVRGLRGVPGPAAWSRLSAAYLATGDPRVKVAVLETLPAFRGAPAAFELARLAAGERDAALRETLPRILAALGDPRGLDVLEDAYEDSPGLALAEARKLALRAAAGLAAPGSARLERWLRRALAEDPAYVVRREAARQLRARGVAVPAGAAGRRSGAVPVLAERDLPKAFLRSRPVVRFWTVRGTFDITLLPDVAPVHAWNLLQLVRSGRYRGRPFHRVVPNFVVQGGDHRGDGFGARAWHGGHLRDEIHPAARFLPGAVGMPRTEDEDTGGDQFFVSTVPTPRLDGAYTAFGRVTRGLEVVRAIEVGDVVVDCVVISDGVRTADVSGLRSR